MNFKKEIKKLDAQPLVKILVIGAILAYVAFQFPYFYPFPEITSIAVAAMLNLSGHLAAAVGHLVIVDGLPPLEISAECSGVVLLMIFPLVIFLIPRVNMRHRLASFFFLPILFFGNILRIFVDVLMGLEYGPDTLIFFHDTIGQVFIFFWTIALYIIWLKIFNNFPKEKRIIHPDGFD